MRRLIPILVCAALLFGAGCGSGSSSTPPTVYVTISPLSVSVSLGTTQQFTETTSGSTNTDVTWQVNGITGGNSTYGTISTSGLYTPPSTVPNPATVTVTVVSQANQAYLANAAVTIVSGALVSVSPATVDLQLAQTQQFTATVTGSTNTSVTWQAGGVPGGNSTVGTISSNGLYRAPSSGSTPFGVSITAVSQVDATKSGTASVTVHGGITVSVTPDPATVATFGALQFAAAVTGTSHTGVTWLVNGVTGGSATTGVISTIGLYTAPNSVPTQVRNGKRQTITVTVTATSQADSTATASVVLTITPPNQKTQSSPTVLGVSGGNALATGTSSCCSGTLGALVSRAGKQYLLSTNHVLARSDQASTGESIIQPGLVDTSCSTTGTTAVATLSQFASLENPPSARPVVDAALAQVVTGKVDPGGSILQLGAITSSGEPTDGAPLAGSGGAPTVQLAVAKSGRSTGLTCSTISTLNLTTNIDYQRSCGSDSAFTVTFTNLVAIASDTFSAEGDSGSLIVNQGTSEPVALLIAASDTDTIAAPVSDVLSALADPNTSEQPVFVGTATAHAVAACSLPGPQTASTVATAAATVPPEKLQAAASVRDSRAAEVLANYAIQSVGVGASLDQPGEAALLLFVSNKQAPQTFPQTIDGISTRVVKLSSKPQARVLSATESALAINASVSEADAALSGEELMRASSVKAQRVQELLKRNGVQGVGVGASADHPGEAALVIFTVRGVTRDVIPATLDGVRTRIRESNRFRLGSGSARTGGCKLPSKPTREAEQEK